MNLPLEYNKLSAYFDALGGSSPDSVNRTIEKILKKYKVRTVLDLTCGTGSQVLWLAKHGYSVAGSDISPYLIKIAKSKARKEKVKAKFLEGDILSIQVGHFDAVITIFNAIGHLTKSDFENAIKNIHKNLNKGGLYIFDIFNLNYINDESLPGMTMDYVKRVGDTRLRHIQYSELDKKKGRIISYDHFSLQKNSHKAKILKGKFALQIYTAKELREMLARNGFAVLNQRGLDGSKFLEKRTKEILTIATKL